MRQYRLHKEMQTNILFLLFIFTTSCNGQTSRPSAKDSPNEQKTRAVGLPKTTDESQTTAYGPGDIVQCAIQDKVGNLWFGTGKGVYRYDGKSFTNYTEKEGLCNNEVGTIFEDKAGNLWFGTNNGACRYDGKTFTSVPIPNDDRTQNSRKNIVTGILQDQIGNFWFGTLDDGVYRYDGKTFTNFLSPEVVKCIFEDRAGNIWVGSWSNGGVFRSERGPANQDCLKNSCKHNLGKQKDLTAHNQALTRPVTDFTWQDGLSDGMIACIFEAQNGNLWFGTRDHGVDRYDGKSFSRFSEQDGLCNNNVSTIVADKTGNLWFGSAVKLGFKIGGLCRYDGKTFVGFDAKEGLENNDFFCGIKDKAGNLWFGGRYGRLFRFDGNAFSDFSEQVHRQ